MATKAPSKATCDCADLLTDLRIEVARLRDQSDRERADRERWGGRAWALLLAFPGVAALLARLAGF